MVRMACQLGSTLTCDATSSRAYVSTCSISAVRTSHVCASFRTDSGSLKDPTTWPSWALICFAGAFSASRMFIWMLSRLADSMSILPSCPPPSTPTFGEFHIVQGIPENFLFLFFLQDNGPRNMIRMGAILSYQLSFGVNGAVDPKTEKNVSSTIRVT
ncbi:hypothetical protein VTN02DRAFT_3075 [Thermoascus thermophilus]